MSNEPTSQRITSEMAEGVIVAATGVSSASVSCVEVVEIEQKRSERDLKAGKEGFLSWRRTARSYNLDTYLA